MWRTSTVCHPVTGILNSNTCSVQDPKTNYTFNLMPLSELNHYISINKETNFIINVCKPVLYDLDAMCPPNSSVCFVNSTEKDLKKRFVQSSGIIKMLFLTKNII